MTDTDLQLSPDQVEAIEAVRGWWRGDAQTFALAGYAGTGKTTVISRLLDELKDRVLVGAPTGKAAARLREKGVGASTIHQLAYRYAGIGEDGDPEFDFVGLRGGDAMVIIDEASMVNSEMHENLVDEGYRMLFVGDHGQLPPVGGDPGLMRNPDFVLREIHRQDDRGLLDFAHALRGGAWVPKAGGAAHTLWLDPRGAFPDADKALGDADVVICWRNATRHWLNHRIMQLRGLVPERLPFDPDPSSAVEVLRRLCADEKPFPVVCLRNNYRARVFNGEVYEMRIDEAREDHLVAVLRADAGAPWGQPWRIDLRGFRGNARAIEPPPNTLLFDFGCCLTAHKSQGSEWPRVCVFDDTHRRMEDRARWAYTAATRAQQELVWMHR